MGAARKLIKETCDAAGVARVERGRFAVERYRVSVAPEDDGPEGHASVVLAITHEHQRSPSAPWSADRSARHRMSPAAARILANLLVLAADRAEADQPQAHRGEVALA